jgi:hypothetical protein
MPFNVLRITVSGQDTPRAAALDVLRAGLQVTSVSRPHPNRHEPGARIYVHAQPRPALADAPLARAEDAKRRRDLPGEIAILTGAQHDLDRQPWMPLRGGDVVLTFAPPGRPGLDALSETHLALEDPDGFGIGLRQVSTSYTTAAAGGEQCDEQHPDDEDQDDDEPDGPAREYLYSIEDLWFEWGPAALTVLRAGAVVFGTPTRTTNH